MLKKTNIKLELLTDYDMLLFFENSIRGGISQCCTRYFEANNKYMGDRYKKFKDDSFILYLDANNLYGWAMSQKLPIGEFTWVTKEDLTYFQNEANILKLPDDEYGFFFEVTIDYPSYLHDMHNDFPFLCESKIPPGGKYKKLLTTLEKK